MRKKCNFMIVIKFFHFIIIRIDKSVLKEEIEKSEFLFLLITLRVLHAVM
jgi:hypothetical protein